MKQISVLDEELNGLSDPFRNGFVKGWNECHALYEKAIILGYQTQEQDKWYKDGTFYTNEELFGLLKITK